MSVQVLGAWVCVILIQVSILCLLGLSLPGGLTISVVPLRLGGSYGMRRKRVCKVWSAGCSYVMLPFCFPKAPLPRVNHLLLKCLSGSYRAWCLRGSNAAIGVNHIKLLCTGLIKGANEHGADRILTFSFKHAKMAPIWESGVSGPLGAS